MGFGVKQADVAAIKAVTDNLPDAGALSDLAILLAAASPEIAQILGDTGELQTDWANGGRLDLLIDAIPTTAMRGTDNAALASVLGALDTAAATGAVSNAKLAVAYLKQLVTKQLNATDGFGALKTLLDAIPTTMRGTDSAALASAWTAALATALGNYTAARAVYLDELDFDLQGTLSTIAGYIDAEIATIITSQGREILTMDFWSDTQEELLINATAGDKSLPTVTVAELPAGATIVRAVAMFKFRMVENVYAGANAINVAQHIQVRDDTPGTWRDAISIADNLVTFTEAAREGGDLLIGDHDIAVEVDANDGYNFQWDQADADQISINFNDIQVGLRIWYSV
ncbi:hypothetical protein LCGC14_1969760 [marine sediment metagenome]|uniref:Uncharacterized protein n=1 Tax=marine sediment metagenome TaxID=412755 RepID=A0A0F9I933_9ZZZZ